MWAEYENDGTAGFSTCYVAIIVHLNNNLAEKTKP